MRYVATASFGGIKARKELVTMQPLSIVVYRLRRWAEEICGMHGVPMSEMDIEMFNE